MRARCFASLALGSTGRLFQGYRYPGPPRAKRRSIRGKPAIQKV